MNYLIVIALFISINGFSQKSNSALFDISDVFKGNLKTEEHPPVNCMKVKKVYPAFL
ncbi:MAG: hypothetical protein RLZZ543_298, partial [Bacteroidota bacterium]